MTGNNIEGASRLAQDSYKVRTNGNEREPEHAFGAYAQSEDMLLTLVREGKPCKFTISYNALMSATTFAIEHEVLLYKIERVYPRRDKIYYKLSMMRTSYPEQGKTDRSAEAALAVTVAQQKPQLDGIAKTDETKKPKKDNEPKTFKDRTAATNFVQTLLNRELTEHKLNLFYKGEVSSTVPSKTQPINTRVDADTRTAVGPIFKVLKTTSTFTVESPLNINGKTELHKFLITVKGNDNRLGNISVLDELTTIQTHVTQRLKLDPKFQPHVGEGSSVAIEESPVTGLQLTEGAAILAAGSGGLWFKKAIDVVAELEAKAKNLLPSVKGQILQGVATGRGGLPGTLQPNAAIGKTGVITTNPRAPFSAINPATTSTSIKGAAGVGRAAGAARGSGVAATNTVTQVLVQGERTFGAVTSGVAGAEQAGSAVGQGVSGTRAIAVTKNIISNVGETATILKAGAYLGAAEAAAAAQAGLIASPVAVVGGAGAAAGLAIFSIIEKIDPSLTQWLYELANPVDKGDTVGAAGARFFIPPTVVFGSDSITLPSGTVIHRPPGVINALRKHQFPSGPRHPETPGGFIGIRG